MEKNNIKELPLGVQIKWTNKSIITYIDNYLSATLGIDLHGMEGMALQYIFHHVGTELTATDIVRRFNVTKATASQMLHRLEKKDLITMSASAKDGRQKVITLTKRGKEVFLKFEDSFASINAQVVKGLSADEKNQMIRLLEKIRDNMQSAQQELQKGEE